MFAGWARVGYGTEDDDRAVLLEYVSQPFFRPFRGLVFATLRPPAPYGVGCILSPLRGWNRWP